MSEKWVESYKDLKNFIVNHAEIEINANGVGIASDIRPEFYRYFDAVRVNFVKEYYAPELDKAYELGKAYADISKLVQQDMKLEAIDVGSSLSVFLLDALDSLKSVLFVPLFSLLQGKTDETRFVLDAHSAVKAFFSQSFREGYDRWCIISLLHLLSASCLWDGTPRDLDSNPHSYTEFYPGFEDDVPELQQKDRLKFAYFGRATFLVPDVLVKSEATNAYVSLKSLWYDVRWKAKLLNGNLEWLDRQQLHGKFGAYLPDMTIHLARESADELKLLADYYHMARPDILIEFMECDDWYDAKRIERIIHKNKMFTPRLGSYVISRVIVPPEAFLPPVEPVAEQPEIVLPLEIETAVEAQLPTEIAPVELVESELLETAVKTDDADNLVPPLSSLATPTQVKRLLNLSDLPDNIHVISAGYNVDALEPIVQALSQWLALQSQILNQKHEVGELQVVNNSEIGESELQQITDRGD
ncbi:MAG: hypothetical protein FWC25_03210 [Dehalococcoidia bacterium]|nr:hypothetical protein [Dehalococcoidia bacterium]